MDARRTPSVPRGRAAVSAPLLCFQGRLNQVFLNKIVNAAQAVGTTKRKDGLIRVISRCDGVAVTVTISDNGGGIPPKIQHQVFDPFFTTKPVGKGRGQGLSLACDIVASHGGTLSFEAGWGTHGLLRAPTARVPGRVETGLQAWTRRSSGSSLGSFNKSANSTR